MGFIKAFAGALGGTFADQWKDFIVPRSDVPATAAVFGAERKGTEFMYITDLPVTDKNIENTVEVGRARWKIENEGFNIQKNGTFDIGHLYSRNATAIKVHYILIQMTHIVRQMLEKGSKDIKELKLKIKEISQFIAKELISNIIQNIDNPHRIQLRFDE